MPESLSGKRIQNLVLKRLERYRRLNLLEEYAVFMGKSQWLEMALKQVHARRSGIDLEIMERWTLGRVTRELKNSGLRADFIYLLESFVKYRNHMAHEFLVDEAMLRALVGTSGRLVRKRLALGAYELEQLLVLFEWTERRDAWS